MHVSLLLVLFTYLFKNSFSKILYEYMTNGPTPEGETIIAKDRPVACRVSLSRVLGRSVCVSVCLCLRLAARPVEHPAILEVVELHGTRVGADPRSGLGTRLG